jgi:hypothetical protein
MENHREKSLPAAGHADTHHIGRIHQEIGSVLPLFVSPPVHLLFLEAKEHQVRPTLGPPGWVPLYEAALARVAMTKRHFWSWVWLK